LPKELRFKDFEEATYNQLRGANDRLRQRNKELDGFLRDAEEENARLTSLLESYGVNVAS
jgi:hypothetical protein